MDRELTTLEHVHKVVQNLMWVYGDAEEPQDECVKFITRLLHQQLSLFAIWQLYQYNFSDLILSGAYDTAKSREKSEIGLIEILFEFRRDALYLRRLLRYINNVEVIEPFPKCLPQESTDYEDTGIFNLTPRTNSSGNYYACKTKALLDALAEIDVMGEISSCISNYDTFTDAIKLERDRQISIRTAQMDQQTYARLSATRQSSFCFKSAKRSQSSCENFIRWLKPPPLEQSVTLILNFCAIEIIASVVSNADLVRRQEGKNIRPLQMRHYHESLRRNIGYSRRRNVLGNF